MTADKWQKTQQRRGAMERRPLSRLAAWTGRLMAAALLGLPALLCAEDKPVTINVTVERAPCEINNNRTIDVNFQEVMTTKIEGDSYRQKVDYSLWCPGSASPGVKMKIQGTAASFNSTLLRTNKTGLGIAIRQDGKDFPVNQWTNFTYPAQPALEAVLIKQAGTVLTGGEFLSSATMLVDYQ